MHYFYPANNFFTLSLKHLEEVFRGILYKTIVVAQTNFTAGLQLVYSWFTAGLQLVLLEFSVK